MNDGMNECVCNLLSIHIVWNINYPSLLINIHKLKDIMHLHDAAIFIHDGAVQDGQIINL